MATDLSSKCSAERRADRRFSDQSAVFVADGALARRCALIDISVSGARILIGDLHDLPSRFMLVDPATGRSRAAELVWRNAAQAGVRLLEIGACYRLMVGGLAGLRGEI